MQLIDKSTLVEYIEYLIEKNQNQEDEFFNSGNPPDYARNFICDFILGKEQTNSQLTLF